MPTTPPALTPVLEFPATGDPAFNAKAFAWGTAERTTTAPEIAALAANAYANAIEGADSAAQAAISATTATTQAGIATTQATLAATSAATATNAANVQGTSTSNVVMPTAPGQERTFVFVESSRAIALGMFVLVAASAAPANYIVLQVTGWTPGTRTLTGLVAAFAGSGTHAAWSLSLTGPLGLAGLGSVAAYTAPLHRSNGSVADVFIYDTRQDSDGGAWVARAISQSWYGESLSGAWLGQHASEAAARAVLGATTNDYFQLTTNGLFYRLSAGAGTAQTYRGSSAAFPVVGGLVRTQTQGLVIYDLTQPGAPMWMHFIQSAQNILNVSTGTAVVARNGEIITTSEGNAVRINLIADFALTYTTATTRYNSNIAARNGNASFINAAGPALPNTLCTSAAMDVLPDAPISAATGLPIPTIAIGSIGGLTTILPNHTAVINLVPLGTSTPVVDKVGTIPGVGWLVQSQNDRGRVGVVLHGAYDVYAQTHLDNSISSTQPTLPRIAGVFGFDSSGLIAGNHGVFDMRIDYANRLNTLINHRSGLFNTGWLAGDTRRCYVYETATTALSNPATLGDGSSFNSGGMTVYGTLQRVPVAVGAGLTALSGFSATNYAQQAFSGQLEFGTGGFRVAVWFRFTGGGTETFVYRGNGVDGAEFSLYANGGAINFYARGATTQVTLSSTSLIGGNWYLVTGSYDGTTARMYLNGALYASAAVALGSMNNATATLTLGNGPGLSSPALNILALPKIGINVPTAEKELFIYSQEKEMFRDGAQITHLTDTDVQAAARDPATGETLVITTTSDNIFNGLVRTSASAITTSYLQAAATSGYKLVRLNGAGWVDVRTPGGPLLDTIRSKKEQGVSTAFDFDAVAAQTDFTLPAGYAAQAVYSAGSQRRKGVTRDYTVRFDGFVQTVRFAVAPGAGVWVQIHAAKEGALWV